MATWYTREGVPIVLDGDAAIDVACCCGGCCCQPVGLTLSLTGFTSTGYGASDDPECCYVETTSPHYVPFTRESITDDCNYVRYGYVIHGERDGEAEEPCDADSTGAWEWRFECIDGAGELVVYWHYPPADTATCITTALTFVLPYATSSVCTNFIGPIIQPDTMCDWLTIVDSPSTNEIGGGPNAIDSNGKCFDFDNAFITVIPTF